jgi:hypothetical protein
MDSGRLEAFSDGVLAIIITISVFTQPRPEAEFRRRFWNVDRWLSGARRSNYEQGFVGHSHRDLAWARPRQPLLPVESSTVRQLPALMDAWGECSGPA